jgi:hypothetical protein
VCPDPKAEKKAQRGKGTKAQREGHGLVELQTGKEPGSVVGRRFLHLDNISTETSSAGARFFPLCLCAFVPVLLISARRKEMLVLSRKTDQSLVIDGPVEITVIGVRGRQVQLGIVGDGKVLRKELILLNPPPATKQEERAA